MRVNVPSYRCARRAQVLIEFALVAGIMFLLLAVTFEFGRGIFSVQVTQNAADHIAHGLAISVSSNSETKALSVLDPISNKKKLDPAKIAELLKNANVYSEDFLVLDITSQALDVNLLPSGNRLLVPLMIAMDHRQNPNIPAGAKWLVYPGELVSSDTAATKFTIRIPIVDYESGPGKTSDVPVVFTEAELENGDKNVLVKTTLKYPFQAATLSGRKASADPPATPNDAYIEVPASEQLQSDELGGPYSGASGLGRQAAFEKTVRPYRRVISGEGSREVTRRDFRFWSTP